MAEKVVLLPLVLSKKSNPYDFSDCTLIYPFLCLAVSPRQVSEKGQALWLPDRERAGILANESTKRGGCSVERRAATD